MSRKQLTEYGLAITLLGAVGCGQGLFDGDGAAEITRTVGPEGGEIALAQARLTIPSKALSTPVSVTMRRPAQPGHLGALGPTFAVSTQEGEAFRQSPVLAIVTPSIPADAATDDLRLARLSLRADSDSPALAWVPLTSSGPDGKGRNIDGPLEMRAWGADVEFAVVLACVGNEECRQDRGELCWSGACQPQ